MKVGTKVANSFPKIQKLVKRIGELRKGLIGEFKLVVGENDRRINNPISAIQSDGISIGQAAEHE